MASESYSSTYDNEDEYTVPLPVVVIVNVVLCFVTVVGNAMVVAAYIRDEKIRKTVAYTLILNLSVTDLLVGLFIFPINTVWWITDDWMLGEFACKFWLVLDYSVLMMSTFTIVFISLDRYWLLTKGLEYQRFQTFRQVIVVLSSAWIITIFLYTFIAFAIPSFLDDMAFDPKGCELEVVETSSFNIFELIVQFIIPFSALVFLNYRVYSNIRERAKGMVNVRYERSMSDVSANISKENGRQENVTIHEPESFVYVNETIELKEKEMNSSNSISFTSLDNENVNGVAIDHGEGEAHAKRAGTKNVTYSAVVTDIDGPSEVTCPSKIKREPPVVLERRKSQVKREKNEFKRHRKAAITLGVLVAVFFVCWLPYYICAIIKSFTKDFVGDRTWEIVTYFQWCNSTINPFIYGFTNLLFRRNFVKFMGIESCVNKSRLHSGSEKGDN